MKPAKTISNWLNGEWLLIGDSVQRIADRKRKNKKVVVWSGMSVSQLKYLINSISQCGKKKRAGSVLSSQPYIQFRTVVYLLFNNFNAAAVKQCEIHKIDYRIIVKVGFATPIRLVTTFLQPIR